MSLGETWAAPLPNPGRHAGESLVSADWIGGTRSSAWKAEGCSGDRCVSTLSEAHTGLRVGLRPVDPFSVWVTARYGQLSAAGSGHTGLGPAFSAGASLAWPGRGIRPAISAQYNQAWGRSRSGEDHSSSALWNLQLSPQVLWGSGEQGATIWAGPEFSPWGDLELDMKVDDVQLILHPHQWTGVLVGGELRSENLSAPGRTPSYLSAGVQGQLGAGMGLSCWMGLAF